MMRRDGKKCDEEVLGRGEEEERDDEERWGEM
jgi:hypothetical protein